MLYMLVWNQMVRRKYYNRITYDFDTVSISHSNG